MPATFTAPAETRPCAQAPQVPGQALVPGLLRPGAGQVVVAADGPATVPTTSAAARCPAGRAGDRGGRRGGGQHRPAEQGDRPAGVVGPPPRRAGRRARPSAAAPARPSRRGQGAGRRPAPARRPAALTRPAAGPAGCPRPRRTRPTCPRPRRASASTVVIRPAGGVHVVDGRHRGGGRPVGADRRDQAAVAGRGEVAGDDRAGALGVQGGGQLRPAPVVRASASSPVMRAGGEHDGEVGRR